MVEWIDLVSFVILKDVDADGHMHLTWLWSLVSRPRLAGDVGLLRLFPAYLVPTATLRFSF